MNPQFLRVVRVPLTIVLAWYVLMNFAPRLMANYDAYLTRPGFSCAALGIQLPGNQGLAAGGCRTLSDMYGTPFFTLFFESALRSLALLAGAALLALTVGTLLGIAGGLLRRRAFASGGIIAITTLLTAVPSFFVAYFLQIIVIVYGASKTSREFLLPVFGFGWDSHIVLPLLAVSVPAVAYTAQLTATRLADVLDTDFITTARAKGLRMRWIVIVHAFPHVRPVLVEALGSGLRISVASLPIVEYIFLWRGIGQLSLEALGIHDLPGFVFTAVVMAALFTTLSAIADLSRPKALYRAS
jgi:ABC-type dipeptide/oligopeptide/nickel transport system permease component